MKHLLLGLAVCSLSLPAMAQQAPHFCATDLERQRLIAADPTYLLQEAAKEADILRLLQANAEQRDGETVFVVPVVFHIVHLNGPENIPNEQVFDAMRILNEDFRKLNRDTINIHPAFQDIIADAHIEFRLPTKDPLGNCTNGIIRYQSPQTLLGESTTKVDPWPRDMYLNIWVTRQINSGAAGYFTGAPSIADGVMILHTYVGSSGIGSSNGVGYRALTHEVGHYLSLNHVWGESNSENQVGIHMQPDCGDDGVADTPITRGWNTCTTQNQWADCDRLPFTNILYNFDATTTSSGTTDPTPVTNVNDTATGVLRTQLTPFTATGVSSNSDVAGEFAFSNWGTGANDGETDFANLTGAFDANKYYSVTITPEISDLLTISNVVFKVNRNATGMRTFAVRSSANNYANNLPVTVGGSPLLTVRPDNVVFYNNDETTQVVTVTVTPPSATHLDRNTPVTLRFYAWNAEDASGTFMIDDLRVNGVSGRIENVQNYMEYSYCDPGHMFTEGQVDRMRAFIQSASSERSSLWTEQNLQNTGIAPGYEMVCSPLADFYAVVGTTLTNPVIPFNPLSCPGTNVRFMDNSTRAIPTSWSWSFQDGTPATSTERNPTVSFSGHGWKQVTLTVSNANGADTKVNDYAILIGDGDNVVNGSYQEGFENVGIWPYLENNFGNNHTHFQQYMGSGHSGNACAFLNSGARNPLNFIDPTNANDIDDLLSINMNLDNMVSAQLSFWYSYSTNTTNIDTVSEVLQVYSSTDCGRTWSLRGSITGSALITNGNITTGPGSWVQKSFTLPASVLTDGVRFRWRFTSSEFSNNLFIDDINISGSVGVEELTADRMLNVFPNPSNDLFAVQAYGMDRFRTQVTVMDLRGAVVFNNTYAPIGGSGVQLSTEELGMSNGLYLIRVSNEAGTSTQKFTVGH